MPVKLVCFIDAALAFFRAAPQRMCFSPIWQQEEIPDAGGRCDGMSLVGAEQGNQIDAQNFLSMGSIFMIVRTKQHHACMHAYMRTQH